MAVMVLDGQVIRPSDNALVDDLEWCGHAFVSLRSWTCPDCGRFVTAATRKRLEETPTKAPRGFVWALEQGVQNESAEDGHSDDWLVGVFTDRGRIAALLVRHQYVDRQSLRSALARIHWYQGVFNPWVFEGWAEADDEDGRAEYVEVSTRAIDDRLQLAEHAVGSGETLMPQSWLPYLPSKLLSETADWGFTNSVTSSMGSLLQQGQDLMKPVTEQVTEVVRQALPAPAPTPAPSQPAMPEVTPFSLPSLESWGMHAPAPAPAAPQQPIDMGPTPPPAPQATPAPAQSLSGGLGAAVGGALGAAGFSLPSLDAWGVVPSRAGTSSASQTTSAAPARVPGGAGSPPASGAAAPRSAALSAPAGGWEGKAYAAAVKAGHPNPAEFVEQIRQESGYDEDVITGKRASTAGAQGIAQIMPAVARAAGVNPLDPDAALAYAAGRMAKNYQTYGDSDRALAEYNMGAGNLQKYGPRGLPETKTYLERIQGATKGQAAAPQPAPSAPAQGPSRAGTSSAPQTTSPRPGSYTKDALVPNQVTEGAAQGLTAEEALAVCGPAAAVAFARANGRNPTLREAKELGQSMGVWDVNVGMHGPASEVQLLQKMGVQARLQQGADWASVAQEVQAGRPVIIDTPNHYFVATGFDPQTGEFEFGQSAGVLRAAKGRTRFKPQDLPSLNMGSPRATIFLGGQP